MLDPMAIYVVETFLSRERAADLELQAARLREAFSVRHLASYFLPDEETTLHVVQATSPDAVREALERAGVFADRIVEADTVDLQPEQAVAGSLEPPGRRT